MKVFFDNCLAPVFAETLNAFIQREGHSAYHISAIAELPNGRKSKDVEWIDFLRQSRDVWIFITGDGRVMKNPAERAALLTWPQGWWIDPARNPVLHLDAVDGDDLVITYPAGFGDTASSIPADLQLAIMDQAARLYDLRGAEDGVQGLSLAASRIAARYRRVAVA